MLCFVHKYILPARMYISGTYGVQNILLLISQIQEQSFQLSTLEVNFE